MWEVTWGKMEIYEPNFTNTKLVIGIEQYHHSVLTTRGGFCPGSVCLWETSFLTKRAIITKFPNRVNFKSYL